MNKASRMILARQLIYCAKMVLDAHILTASCSAYGKLKNLIMEINPELKSDITKHGLEKLKGSGYVIHHLLESPHFLDVNRKYAEYKRMIDVLNNTSLQNIKVDESKITGYTKNDPLPKNDAELYHALRYQINHVMFIPEWFHNYLHKHKLNFTDKNAIYKHLQDNLKNGQLFKRVKSLQFKSGSPAEAAKSLYNIASIVKQKDKDDVIKILRFAYKQIRKKLS